MTKRNQGGSGYALTANVLFITDYPLARRTAQNENQTTIISAYDSNKGRDNRVECQLG